MESGELFKVLATDAYSGDFQAFASQADGNELVDQETGRRVHPRAGGGGE